ncbi:30S ribosomal protein S1 [Candidatus Poribacteria bacterium]|nr:30S ribosomal protein S1 [Candidatus Poribacteria bacterium]
MNNEQNHTDDSTVNVDTEEETVDGTTETEHDEVSETETTAPIDQSSDSETEVQDDGTDDTSEVDEDNQVEFAADETDQGDLTDNTEDIIQFEENPPTEDPDSDISDENQQTPESVDAESDTSEEQSDDTPSAEETNTDTTDDSSETVDVTAESDTVEDSSSQEETDTGEEQAAMSQESLEEAYDNSLKAFTDGEIVKGTVVDVSRDEVMIDIGFKSEGYIPASEFDSQENDLPTVAVGDQIDVYIVRREDMDGQIVLSKKIADQTLVWDEITEAFESGTPVEGRITERIKGGLQVYVGSLRGFLPASQVELRPISNLDEYIGEVFPMKVISMSKRRHNIVLSRRAFLEAEMAEKKEEVLKNLEVGQLINGVVKNITAFGAFVDLGGVDGLLHKTDMAWKRINHPSEIVAIGDELEVQVIAIGEDNEKISLGLKQKTNDPWENVEEKYIVGSRVSGAVVNIVNYGVFVQLEEAVEGLIHVSEMSWTRRNVAPSRIVTKGEEIEAIVLEISKEDKRISLGIKQLQENPWELLEQRYPVGTKINGRIRNLTNFGAFVEIEEGIDGLIHTSDLSWTDRATNPQEFLKEGDEVEVVVLQIDASERRVSLGLKQTQPDPWSEVPEKYKVGSVVRGKIVNLTSFGAFTKLEEGIDGLIHISEIADRRIERPEEVVSVGDEIDVKVINLDPKGRRIGLSLKAAIADQERAANPPDEQEHQERPRRERHAPQRQQRQPEPVEEEETIMGALLKQEMGKNNVNNLTNTEETETNQEVQSSEDTDTPEVEEQNTEESVETEVTDETQSSENSDTPDDSENPDDSQPSEDDLATQEPENSEN